MSKFISRFLYFLIDGAVANLRIVKSNLILFCGIAFLIFGILGFESDKYCDGNAANYLSCTRPATYYFYDWFDMAFIALGAFLVVLWFLKRKGH